MRWRTRVSSRRSSNRTSRRRTTCCSPPSWRTRACRSERCWSACTRSWAEPRRRGIHVGRARTSPTRERKVRPMTPEQVLDFRTVPPARRYRQTFETFEALEPGAGFELVSEHDPWPLYFQFTARPSVPFTWKYLENGPKLWRVRVVRLEPVPRGRWWRRDRRSRAPAGPAQAAVTRRPPPHETPQPSALLVRRPPTVRECGLGT